MLGDPLNSPASDCHGIFASSGLAEVDCAGQPGRARGSLALLAASPDRKQPPPRAELRYLALVVLGELGAVAARALADRCRDLQLHRRVLVWDDDVATQATASIG